MISKQLLSNTTVSLDELFPNYTQAFLKPFKHIMDTRLAEEMHLDFEIMEKKHHKISPILRQARPDDAKEITEIYKDLYENTYPYKEMEDEYEVRRMIEDPCVQWVIYQDPSYNIAGCITFVLDFDNRRGYIRGFMLKKKYQGYIDITKAMIGSMLAMLHKYKDLIYIWYVENRTAHAKSQYSMWVCGIAPIGIYPNKDIFLGQIESDLMQILYDEGALRKYRCKSIPEIIPQVDVCFLYSDNRYKLGSYKTVNPVIKLNKMKLNRIRKKLQKKVVRDKFGYKTITLMLEDSNSYFEFLYTPQVQNFEKTHYCVDNLEELYVFTQEFLHYKKEFKVRYCEVFISAYSPEHQQIFYNAGFLPRGYIPSWDYCDNEDCFKDSILFSICDGEISKEIQLIKQGQELVQTIGLAQFSEAGSCIEVINPENSKKASVVDVIDTISLFRTQKIVKYSILGAMWLYLSLLFLGLLVASGFGYNITTHTISELGNSRSTPFPYIFDIACIIAGFITIFYSIFIHNTRKSIGINQVINITSFCGLIWGIIGGIAYLFLGFFSSERGGPNGVFHGISAISAFFGFVLSILFFSLQFILRVGVISKLFGICGVIIPTVILLLNFIQLTPLLEWILLFSILVHIIPLNYWSVRK
ncbi:MAG: DUF998 domain-containing protein [Promethearchaeota archaeon]